MSLDSPNFKRKIQDIESFICNKRDAIAFLDEITNTDIIQVHTHINKYDAVSRKELAFLVGLLLKKTILTNNLASLNEAVYEEQSNQIREKLRSLHFEFFVGRDKDLKKGSDDYFISETLVESIFYEESGFYNDQPLMLSSELYKSSKEWIEKNKNFKLDSLPYFYFSVCGTIYEKRKKYMESNVRYTVGNIFFTVDDILELNRHAMHEEEVLSREEITSIINSFSCRPGEQFESFSRPGDENILSYYPIIEIKKGIYWLPLPDMLAIACYLSPLHWMRKDKRYKDIANRNIGKDLENMCSNMLSRVFNEVYTSVTILKGKNKITDIDTLVIFDNTAIVVQAKNKRMMPETFSGDIESLKRDFSIVAQQAYDQGEKSLIALLNRDGYSFKGTDGEEIRLPTVTQVFILCVSSSVFYAGALQVNKYLQQKYRNTKLPVILSVFDLDLLTRYLSNPYEFICYLNLRINKYKNLMTNNEVAPLSSYLFTDYLHDNRSDLMLLMDDVISWLDENYYEEQLGHEPYTDKRFSVRYKKAPHFVRILEAAYSSNVCGKEKAINNLLSLPSSIATQISNRIAQYSLTVLNPEKCGFSMVFDEFGISYFTDTYISEKDMAAKMAVNADCYHKHLWVGFLEHHETQVITFLCMEKGLS